MTSDLPSGVLSRLQYQRNPTLARASIEDLLAEAMARLLDGEDPARSEQGITLGDALQEELVQRLEVHENRFSVRRLRDLFHVFHGWIAEPKPPIRDAAYVDLGCGSHNPLGLLFVFVVLGARRGTGIDLDKIQDPARALRAMVRAADTLRTEPSRIVADYAVTREEVERGLAAFGLDRIRAGDASGIDGSRLTLLHESATRLPFPPGSVDVVISNSFLEHVADLDQVIAEIARITVPGGFGVHNIDGIDHWSYGDPSRHPLDFLRDAQPGMVNGSNRVRPLQYPEVFRRHGFEVQQIRVDRRVPVSDQLLASFAPAWRVLPREWLESGTAILVVRRT